MWTQPEAWSQALAKPQIHHITSPSQRNMTKPSCSQQGHFTLPQALISEGLISSLSSRVTDWPMGICFVQCFEVDLSSHWGRYKIYLPYPHNNQVSNSLRMGHTPRPLLTTDSINFKILTKCTDLGRSKFITIINKNDQNFHEMPGLCFLFYSLLATWISSNPLYILNI